MYGSGNGTPTPVLPVVAPVVAGVTTATVLPQTGSNLVITLALAAAAALAVWAVVYIVRAKLAVR